MQPQELRIGNYINRQNHSDIMVNSIEYYDVSNKWLVYYNDFSSNEYLQSCKPIPLNEDWLLKFGFDELEICDESGYLYSDYQLETENNVLIWFGLRKEFMQYKHIKHVHQLQNLYFALTGEELTIKEYA